MFSRVANAGSNVVCMCRGERFPRPAWRWPGASGWFRTRAKRSLFRRDSLLQTHDRPGAERSGRSRRRQSRREARHHLGRELVRADDSGQGRPALDQAPLPRLPWVAGYLEDLGDLAIDVNGDGYPDIVTSSYWESPLAWWENPGRSRQTLGEARASRRIAEASNSPSSSTS